MEKEELRASTGSKYRWTDVSVLVLSLLLSACVATIIYMSLHPAASTSPQAASSQLTTTTTPPTTVNVNLKVDDKEVPEKITYDEDHNVAFFYENDGSFTAEDFDKGFVISKNSNSAVCFVVPVGTSMNRTQVRDIMGGYHDGDVITPETGKTLQAQVLPGLIEDTSMFPEEANQQCTGGYMWLTTVDTEGENSFEVSVREKRQVSGYSSLRCYSSYGCKARTYLTFRDSLNRLVQVPVYFCITYCWNSSCGARSYCIG